LTLGAATTAAGQTVQAPPADGSASGRFVYQGFADRDWYTPVLANPRDANSELLFWGQSKRFPYSQGDASHTIWDLSFGKEFPIATWEKVTPDRTFMDGRGWGFGLWAPLSFHMVDAVEEDSSPIIDNDYRLAGALKVAHALSPRDLLSAKFQFGHESTHLGDEFALRALDAYGDDFQRVNVSYEFIEFGANWDHLFGAQRQHMMSVRASALHTAGLRDEAGWYTTTLLDGTPIQPSKINVETAISAEYMPRGTRGFRPFVSYELRLRPIYDYAKASADQREDRQWSSSLVVGLRDLARWQKGMPDVIAKGYYGVNPNGQFRSQRDYWMFGIGLLLRL
jgi:hypothetical protein